MKEKNKTKEQLIKELEELHKRIAEAEKSETERKKAEEKLHTTLNDLKRFNRLAVGRELQMIELKREINDLLHSMGHQEKYKIRISENVMNKKEDKNG